MLILANLLSGIAVVLNGILSLFLILVFGRVIISWVNADPTNPIVRFIRQSTDPVLTPVQKRMPNFGGIDFSPIVVLLIIAFLQAFLVQLLLDYSASLKMGAFG